MNKSDILTLVNQLANFPIDGDLLDVYYDDVLVELGRMTNAPLTADELQEIVSGSHTYTIPDKMISILHAFYSSKSLVSSRTQDVDAYVNEWRDDTGTPFSVLIDELSGKTYRLYPIPQSDNLVTNGDMELDSNWNDTIPVAPHINEQSSTQVKSGSYSRHFAGGGVGRGILSDTFTTVINIKYAVSVWVYPDDTQNVRVDVTEGDGIGTAGQSLQATLTQDAWNLIQFDYVESSGGSSATIKISDYLGAGGTNHWYVDDVTIRRIKVSDPFSFITGTPMGTDFPDNAVTLIYSELRDVDILDFIGLPIALMILNREFIRQSDHRDIIFAQSCNDIAKLMLTFIGVGETK